MPMPILYDSFTYLVRLLRDGQLADDTPESFYYFRTPFNVEALAAIINTQGLQPEKVSYLTERLINAENSGRLFWRPAVQDIRSERQNFVNLLNKMREVNPEVPVWNYVNRADAYWNRVSMREMLGSTVTYGNRL